MQTKTFLASLVLAMLMVSCARSAKVTLVDEKGEKISFIEETINLHGKGAGDSIPVAITNKKGRLEYSFPFKGLFAKKGKKMSDGSIYLGQKKLIIQSIEFQFDGLDD